jgi:hypothetical protein
LLRLLWHLDQSLPYEDNPAFRSLVEGVVAANAIAPDPPADAMEPRPDFERESMTLSTILLILAFIAFVLAAAGWGYKKTNLLGIGLALWVLSILITQVHIG